MEQAIVLLYELNELNADARIKALNDHRVFLSESFDDTLIIDYYKEELQEMGYPTDEINFSLSSSQGNGMAFYGNCDIIKLIHHLKDNKLNELFEKVSEHFACELSQYLTISIIKNSYSYYYSRFNTMEVTSQFDYDGLTGPDEFLGLRLFMDVFKSLIVDNIKDISKKLEQEGYRIIKEYQEDTYIADSIFSNEYLFFESGDIANVNITSQIINSEMKSVISEILDKENFDKSNEEKGIDTGFEIVDNVKEDYDDEDEEYVDDEDDDEEDVKSNLVDLEI